MVFFRVGIRNWIKTRWVDLSVAQKSTAYSFSNELNRYNIISFGISPRIHHLPIKSTHVVSRIYRRPKKYSKKSWKCTTFCMANKAMESKSSKSKLKTRKMTQKADDCRKYCKPEFFKLSIISNWGQDMLRKLADGNWTVRKLQEAIQ